MRVVVNQHMVHHDQAVTPIPSLPQTISPTHNAALLQKEISFVVELWLNDTTERLQAQRKVSELQIFTTA